MAFVTVSPLAPGVQCRSSEQQMMAVLVWYWENNGLGLVTVFLFDSARPTFPLDTVAEDRGHSCQKRKMLTCKTYLFHSTRVQ